MYTIVLSLSIVMAWKTFLAVILRLLKTPTRTVRLPTVALPDLIYYVVMLIKPTTVLRQSILPTLLQWHIGIRLLAASSTLNDSGFFGGVCNSDISQTRPTIKQGGVATASAYGGSTTIAPGPDQIYGSSFSSVSRAWTGPDFVGSQGPTTLEGVSVTVDGQKAFISYVSPSQINAQLPLSLSSGVKSLVVTASDQASLPYSVSITPGFGALLAPSAFQVGGKQYAGAVFPDGQTYALPAGKMSRGCQSSTAVR